MDYKVVDMNSYYRKDIFRHFSDDCKCSFAVTARVDVTELKAFSKKTGSVIAITGAIDLVSDANTCYVIRNGHPAMSKITGTGCQLSGLTCAFAAASIVTSPVDNNLDDASSFAMDSCDKSELTASVAAAVITMGLAGEIGYTHLAPYEGNSTYRNRIIDAIYHMDSETFEKGARYEIK